MKIWIADWSDGHDHDNEILGAYATEELAKAAIESDIKCRYAGNSRAHADWLLTFSFVQVYFGCGHSDRYSWCDYDVQTA
jgi:hypothetical protein